MKFTLSSIEVTFRFIGLFILLSGSLILFPFFFFLPGRTSDSFLDWAEAEVDIIKSKIEKLK